MNVNDRVRKQERIRYFLFGTLFGMVLAIVAVVIGLGLYHL